MKAKLLAWQWINIDPYRYYPPLIYVATVAKPSIQFILFFLDKVVIQR